MADLEYVMDDGGEYGKYILQTLQLPPIHATPEAIYNYEKSGRKRIHWLDGDVIPGAFQINTSWYYAANREALEKQAAEEGEGTAIGKPHVHAVDELLCFYGSDPYDPYNLNGEVEIHLNGEPHLLTKSSLIFIPAGMPHLPLYLNRVDKPIFHFSLLLDSSYSFECENGTVFKTK